MSDARRMASGNSDEAPIPARAKPTHATGSEGLAATSTTPTSDSAEPPRRAASAPARSTSTSPPTRPTTMPTPPATQPRHASHAGREKRPDPLRQAHPTGHPEQRRGGQTGD